jgi:hypothetical protein
MIATTRTALERLIDYAGLFPPAQLPLDEALASYADARASAASWMLGRFIIPAGRLDALRAALAGKPIELSVIAAPEAFPAVAAVRRDGWASVGSIEVPLGTGSIEACAREAGAHGLADVPIYVELSRGRLAMRDLRNARFGAKVRCGGVEPAAYPSVAELAAFIDEAVGAGVPFKATAGLHHPVRHFNAAAGVTMHGFLNILFAASRAGDVDRGDLEAILAQEDASAFVFPDDATMANARTRFIAYGSCSFEEPVDDLRALGLIES